MKSLTTIFLCLTAIALILFCFTEDTHTCKWQSCPYKGITKDQWKQSVINYVGIENEGTDSYYIDMLHLEFPGDEYDELENKLFTQVKNYQTISMIRNVIL